MPLKYLFFLFFTTTLNAADYTITIDKYMVQPETNWLITLTDDQANVLHQEKINYHISLESYTYTFSDLPAERIHLQLSCQAKNTLGKGHKKNKRSEIHLFFYNIPTIFFVKNPPESGEETKSLANLETEMGKKKRRKHNDKFAFNWISKSHIELIGLPLNTLLNCSFPLMYSDHIAYWRIYGIVDQEIIDLQLPIISLNKEIDLNPINPMDNMPNVIRIGINHLRHSQRVFARAHPYQLGNRWYIEQDSLEEYKMDTWKWN